MRSFDNQLNADDETWDDNDILNSWANNLQNNLKIDYNSLNNLDGDDTAANDDPMQTFSQWDMAKEKNAVNETGWATFTIDNFADFDQHFNAAFEMPPLSTENEPVITYATSMTTTNSCVGTIGDQMGRNMVNGGNVNGPPSFRHHNSLVDNGIDLFADFESHQSSSLFGDIDANGLDPFDELQHNDDNANVFNTNDIQQNETEQLNFINSMIAVTIATTIPTTTADANGQLQSVPLDDENDKPPPIVPSIQDDNKEQRTVVPAQMGEDNESTSAM